MLAVLALGATSVPADEASQADSKTQTVEKAKDVPLDEELLEFLGSVDSEEGDWAEYLAETDTTISEVKKDE
jgi:hypothetical protein